MPVRIGADVLAAAGMGGHVVATSIGWHCLQQHAQHSVQLNDAGRGWTRIFSAVRLVRRQTIGARAT